MLKTVVIRSMIVFAASWISWWAWLGWDTTKDLNPVTGDETGPYEAWQVFGSVLSVVAVVIVTTAVWGPFVAAVATTVGYTCASTMSAVGQDEQGLAIIGGTAIFIGIAAGSALVAALTRRFGPSAWKRSDPTNGSRSSKSSLR